MNYPRSGKFLLITLLLLLLPSSQLFAQEDLVVSAAEAKDFIGQIAMVCGVVVDTHYAQTSSGRPTYINFEEPYPNALFTVVIWEKDRENFHFNPSSLLGLDLCVYCQITRYKSKPQMKLVRPEQLSRRPNQHTTS